MNILSVVNALSEWVRHTYTDLLSVAMSTGSRQWLRMRRLVKSTKLCQAKPRQRARGHREHRRRNRGGWGGAAPPPVKNMGGRRPPIIQG